MKINYSNQLLKNKLLFNIALIALFILLSFKTNLFYILPIIIILVINLISYIILLFYNQDNYFIFLKDNNIYYKRAYFKKEFVNLADIKQVNYKNNQIIFQTINNEKRCISLNNISATDKKKVLNIAEKINKKSP